MTADRRCRVVDAGRYPPTAAPGSNTDGALVYRDLAGFIPAVIIVLCGLRPTARNRKDDIFLLRRAPSRVVREDNPI